MTHRDGTALAVAVGAVMVLLPFGDVSVPGLGIPLVYAAMLAPLALALRRVVLRGDRVPRSIILTGVGLCLLSAVVSAAVGVDPPRSVPLVVATLITAGYVVAVALAHRPGTRLALLDLLVVVGGVIALLALTAAGDIQSAEAGNVVNGRLTGPFAQPNELGMFCAALLPVALACVVTSTVTYRTALLAVATVLLAVACVLSMSRGAWLGAVAALVFLAVCEPLVRRVVVAVGVVLGLIVTAAFASPASAPLLGVVGARIRTLGDPTQNQYDDRPLVWAEAWSQAAAHPWLGVGPGGFRSAATSSSSVVSAEPPDHAHNLLLTLLADRGVLGVGLAAVVAAGCIVAVRRHVLADRGVAPGLPVARIRSLAVIAALVQVAVHGGFDMPLRNPIVAGLVWTLLGMAVVAETTAVATSHACPDDRAWPPDREHPSTSGRKWVPAPC